MNERLAADCSRAMAKALLNLIAHNYRQEEHNDIWQAFTEVCRSGIEAYDLQSRRLESRLRPSKN
jgi:hypothetical protein